MSAAGVTQWAVNSGWWLTAGRRAEADHRVDRRHGVRHVAHVGRAGEAGDVAARLDERAAERFGVGAVAAPPWLASWTTSAYAGADSSMRSVRRWRARRPRSSASTLRADARPDRRACGPGRCTRADGVRRHDVGRLAAARDDAVDAIARADVLAQQADRRLRDRERVGGVDAQLGARRGVRRLAVVVDVELGAGERGRLGHVERRGVHHHRGVHAVEGAALEQAGSCRRRPPRPACRSRVTVRPEVVGDARQRQRRRRPPTAAMML